MTGMSTHSLPWPFRGNSIPRYTPLTPHLDYHGEGGEFFDFMALQNGTLALFVSADEANFFFARVDPVHRELVFANALRESALLVRKSAARVIHLKISDGEERTLGLEPGDVLVAFTGHAPEVAVVQAIRESPDARAKTLVSRIRELAPGTVVVVRFIAVEEPALAEESSEMELAVA